MRKNPDRSQIQQEIIQKLDRTRPHVIIMLQKMPILICAHATIISDLYLIAKLDL